MSRVLDRGSVVSLILSRVVYAINWYNIASVFTFMAADFHQNVSGLGAMTASLYTGLGLFQIPSGIIAAKFGPKKIAAYGMLISSAAALATAFTSEFYELVVLRFIVGLGFALFFGPGVTLIAKAFRGESQGLGVGLFNGAFYLGGALGLFAWSIIAELTGWRTSLAMSGGLGILGALLLIGCVPKDELRQSFNIRRSDLRRILSNRWLLVLSLELFGIGSGIILINTFMVYYLEQTLKMSPTLAGVIGSLSPMMAILASPLFGTLYDRIQKTRLLLFLLGSTSAVALGMASIESVYTVVGATLMTGASAGALTISFLSARRITAVTPEYESLAVSWVNCIQMFAGLWSPVVFSLLAVSYGYSWSWLIGAAYTFLLISIVLLGRDQVQ